jgi:uracil-DNA glycosylase family 4
VKRTPEERAAAKAAKDAARAQAKLRKQGLLAEPLATAGHARPECAACALFTTCLTPFMRPWVPKGWRDQPVRVLLVGEAPGEHEDEESGRPFTGPAGELLRDLWHRAGLDDVQVALVNSNRCRPPRNRAPKVREIRACRPYVLRVIESLHPHVVIGMGRTALASLTNSGSDQNVTKNRGRLLPVPGLATVTPRVWATYHPSAVLRGATHLEDKILRDLERVFETTVELPESAPPRAHTVAIDTEFTPTNELLVLGVADTWNAVASRVEPAFAPLGADAIAEADILVGHNLPVDLDQLVRVRRAKPQWLEGYDVRDTLLLARMADENGGKGAYELDTLFLTQFGGLPWKDATQPLIKAGRVAEIEPALLAERCRLDTWATAKLAAHYGTLVGKQAGMEPDLVEYTHRIALSLRRIWLAGAVVDLDAFERIGATLTSTADQHRDLLMRAAHTAGLPDFSPTNDNHIRELLFRRLNLESLRATKTKLESVDQMTLAQHDTHPVVANLLAFNKADKLRGLFYGNENPKAKTTPLSRLVQSLDAVVDGVPVGLLRPRINPLGARTGRRSSTAPNFQNWTKPIRRLIRSRWEGGVIADLDYASLEVVLMAWLAGDPKLFAYFTTGAKYIGVGRELWGKSVEKGTRDYTITKSLVLGIDYNMREYKLAEDLWFRAKVKLSADWREHVRQAARLIRLYFRKFPKVEEFIHARRDELLTYGYVTSLTGRVRHLPCPVGEDTPGFKRLWNQAVNFPVQSLASEITGSALMDAEAALCAANHLTVPQYHEMLVDAWLDPRGPLRRQTRMSMLINEVHDSLVVDLDPNTAARDLDIVKSAMREVTTLRILCPAFTLDLGVDASVGPAWGLAHEAHNT